MQPQGKAVSTHLGEDKVWHESILVESILDVQGCRHVLIQDETLPGLEDDAGLARGQLTLLVRVLEETQPGLPNLQRGAPGGVPG